jgi:hypothetical protein
MSKSTPTLTLTQSGLLAVLLRRQCYKRFELAQRHAHGKHLRAAVWSILTWPWRAHAAKAARRFRRARCGSPQESHLPAIRALWN